MDERMKPVLVTGATGSTGSALVKLLRQREVPVRVMVRRKADVTRVDAIPESVVVADFDDVESLAAAVHGISRAYLITPSSEKAETQQNRFAEIAAKAGVEQLVKLSPSVSAARTDHDRCRRWPPYVDRLDAVPATARVMVALGPRVLDLARHRAASAFPVLVTPEYTAQARLRLGADTTLAVEQLVVLETDPERAREIARGPLGFLSQFPA